MKENLVIGLVFKMAATAGSGAACRIRSSFLVVEEAGCLQTIIIPSSLEAGLENVLE